MNHYEMVVALSMTADGSMPFAIDPSLNPTADVWPYSDVLSVDAVGVEVALEEAFREANVGRSPWAKRYRLALQRSLSAGDYVWVNGHGWYAVKMIGFEPADVEDMPPIAEAQWSVVTARQRADAAREKEQVNA